MILYPGISEQELIALLMEAVEGERLDRFRIYMPLIAEHKQTLGDYLRNLSKTNRTFSPTAIAGLHISFTRYDGYATERQISKMMEVVNSLAAERLIMEYKQLERFGKNLVMTFKPNYEFEVLQGRILRLMSSIGYREDRRATAHMTVGFGDLPKFNPPVKSLIFESVRISNEGATP